MILININFSPGAEQPWSPCQKRQASQRGIPVENHSDVFLFFHLSIVYVQKPAGNKKHTFGTKVRAEKD